MANFDDRPISVYDNLNATSSPTTATTTMHTSTPKAKTKSGSRSPYDEIAFKFSGDNKSNNQQQQQQQQRREQQQPLLPNGQSHSHQQQHHQQQQQREEQQHLLTQPQVPSPVHQQQLPQPLTNNALYSIPIKPPTTTALVATTTTPTTAATATITAATTPAAATTTSAAIASNNNASAPRPLSQHSQSELNEASHSIAAVKAALNDAKSKFFGLNVYAQDTPDAVAAAADTAARNRGSGANETQVSQLLESSSRSEADHHRPHTVKVQIVPSSAHHPPQPKYQNIPENSAIYRHQQQQQHQQQQLQPPPALPHKQNDYQNLCSADAPSNLRMATPSPASTSPSSGLSGRMSEDTPTPQQSLPASTTSSQVSPTSADKSAMSSAPSHAERAAEQQLQRQQLPPSAAYKQLPLNDLFDDSHPSQAVYMSTTVPQNIKGSKIAGRHTPTRNSLRHSRMLVINNKNYQGMQHANPMDFKQPNLARWLLILQTLFGTLLTFLAIWIFFLAPNTAVQDNPYWSGLALLLAGAIGLVLIRFRRIKRHKVRENCFLFLRADSYLLSLVALLLCVVATICAAIHFARLTASDTRCIASNMLQEQSSCSCTFNAPALRNATSDVKDFHEWPDEDSAATQKVPEDHSYTVEYRDLSCKEVTGEWILILGASITLNVIGFVISLVYIVLLACCRKNSKRFYASVHTSTF